MRRLLLIAGVTFVGASLTVAPRAQAPAQPRASALKLPPYKKTQLKNGMTLILLERHYLPLVSFHALIGAGAAADPIGQEGLAELTAATLHEGTKMRTADRFADELDFIGGTFGASSDADSTTVNAEFVTKDLAKGLELFADAILHPAFPQDEVAKLVKQRLDALRAAKDKAQGVIGLYFNAYLYGQHLYGRPVSGDETSLRRISHDALAKYYETYYTPGNTILVVAGDFDPAQMEKTLTDTFGDWPARPSPAVSVPTHPPAQGKRLLLIDKPDSTQTFFVMGNVGIARTNPDRVYIQVVNTLFGGRFTSMLNEELRVKSGLTYMASSEFDRRKSPGPFTISTYTRNATTKQAMDLTLDVLKRLHEKGVTEGELASAKNYIKGELPLTIETSDQTGQPPGHVAVLRAGQQ